MKYEKYKRVVKMELNESMLLKKEDVTEYVDGWESENTSKINIYRRGILPYVDNFKKLIENGGGEAVVKIKDIREMLGWEKFKDKLDEVIYYRLRTILLEYGINIKLFHHYGANLVMSFVDNESEIISELEITRMRQEKCAKKAGFPNWKEYNKHKLSYKKKYRINMDDKDKDNKLYFVNIGRKFIIDLFPGAIVNEHSLGGVFADGGYDWIYNGLKIKHVASSLRHSVDKEGFERDYFQWNIFENDVADIFILTGWGDRINTDLMKAWIFDKNEIVNGREFWNRKVFIISTHDRSIDKYFCFEIDDEKLELIREKIETENDIIVTFGEGEEEEEEEEEWKEEEKEEGEGKLVICSNIYIANWYTDSFRTITWNLDDKKLKMIDEV